MEKYSRVFYHNDSLYLESCPVIILASAILKDNETEEILAQVKLKSITSKKIKAVVVELELFDSAGEKQSKTVEHEFLDLNVYRNTEFGSQEAIKLPYNNSRSLSINIKKVVFEDGESWNNKSKKTFSKIEQAKELDTILDSVELDYFKKQYGEKSCYIPTEQKHLWICTCGNFNLKDEKKCYHCGLEKNVILNVDFDELKKAALYDLSIYYLETDNIKLIEEAENNFKNLKNYKDSKKKSIECSEQAEKLKLQKEKQAKKNKLLLKRIIIISIIAIVSISVIIYITKVFIPNKNYNEAKNLIKQEKYSQAIKKLEQLPSDYKDSNEILYDCYVSYAKKLVDEKNFEEAVEIYDKLSSEDLADERLEAIYKYANDLFEKKEYEKAYEQFLLCSRYEDSKDKAKDVAKEMGNTLLESKDYEKAMEWYKKAESNDLINKAKYTYVIDHKNSDDEKTYEYLATLAKDKYEDSLSIYNSLYNIKCTVLINYTKDDTSSRPSKINQYDNGYRDLYAHYKITGNTPTGKANLKTVYETRWGYDNVARENWKENKYMTYDKISKSFDEWQTGYLDMASNLYYHRVTIYNADTGEKICSSNEVYTPYNR